MIICQYYNWHRSLKVYTIWPQVVHDLSCVNYDDICNVQNLLNLTTFFELHVNTRLIADSVNSFHRWLFDISEFIVISLILHIP